ncbi:molybdopterin molybdenumtransferase MoeA [Pseudoxanthomonas yeongjuensis]|uniref:molybdopterin molybdotransferase MoeA n=1 Tax=Pseudoxanthomonas yeongjuensis TaxID=377616 RepID=UPI0013914551|nr:molybdopterin molybdotransferase MoeA [Pseudoxanthomonas yeongjuensis]KAF1716371.1 molybdopterin molybdenumtransferase MoeA [Pseudoxanthomonas yeongjuensis]
MIAYAEALRRVLDRSRLLEMESCSPADARERVLAMPIQAACALPLFDNAAMDGYALASAGGTLRAGGEFRVAGVIVAGGPIPAGTSGAAWEITTGACLPDGFDCVAALENTERLDDGRMRLLADVSPGQNVRRRGSDLMPGEPIALPGQRVEPALCMALAALGVERVEVRRRPRVAILSTGSELVADPSLPLEPGKIRAANAPYLEASLRAFGAEVVTSLTLDDDPAIFAAELQRVAVQADLVLSTGAVSMGRHDFVPASLESIGARLLFHKVGIRPGKPLLAAMLADGPLMIGLPGNPLATAAGFRFFVVPALRAMLGMAQESPLHARLSVASDRRAGLRHFLKARVDHDTHGLLRATLLDGQESFRMAPLLKANAWAVLPNDVDETPDEAMIDVLPLDPGGKWDFG